MYNEVSKRFTNLFKENGIRRHLTTTFTAQQNGIAERINRTVVEITLCLMLDSELPKCLN